MKKNIAILGATSHIAKGLIYNFFKSDGFSLHLYARSSGRVEDFLTSIGKFSSQDCKIHEGFADFPKYDYKVVINCVGIGTLNKHKGNYSTYFTVTEEYDNLVIAYLRENHPNTLYVSFSSGVVYGGGYLTPAEENMTNCISVNHASNEDYYAIARINAEAKHRSFKKLNIVDLRLFSYFSRFIDLADGYFITELIDSILKKKVFLTNDVNIIRDFVHPEDLFSAVLKCIDIRKINMAFDIFSSKPVGKKEILDYFTKEYGLKYEMSDSFKHAGATGSKSIYYSRYSKAVEIGYEPRYSSMDAIIQESQYILNTKK